MLALTLHLLSQSRRFHRFLRFRRSIFLNASGSLCLYPSGFSFYTACEALPLYTPCRYSFRACDFSTYWVCCLSLSWRDAVLFSVSFIRSYPFIVHIPPYLIRFNPPPAQRVQPHSPKLLSCRSCTTPFVSLPDNLLLSGGIDLDVIGVSLPLYIFLKSEFPEREGVERLQCLLQLKSLNQSVDILAFLHILYSTSGTFTLDINLKSLLLRLLFN